MMFGDGTGAFPDRHIQTHAADTVIPRDLAFMDGNGDGRMDVLVGGDTGVYLQRRVD
jgi:hypothetical protein